MNREQHVGRFTLERFLADELTSDEAHVVESHLDSCHTCRTARDRLNEDHEAFVAAVPYAAFRIEHEQRLSSRRSKHRWLPTSILAASALAASAAMVLLALRPPDGDGVITRSKGGSVALTFSVLDNGALRPGVSGETLAPGTRLQLYYDAGTLTHMALLGIDSTGTVAVYFPDASASTLGPLPAGPTGRMPFSLTLDDTPGVERFVAVFATFPAPLGDVLAHDYEQATFYVEKPRGSTGTQTIDSAH